MRERGKGGFWDYVKDPHFFAKKNKAEALQDFWARLKLPKSRSPETIQRMIKRLLKNPPDEATEAWFQRTGKAAVPHLQAALEDETFQRSGYQSIAMGSPVESAMTLLRMIDEESATKAFEKLAFHKDSEIRKESAIRLGSMGREAHCETMARLLGDEDEYVRSYSLMGCSRALGDDKAEAGFGERLFEPTAKLLCGEKGHGNAKQAAELLLKIDRARAIERLLQPPVLDALNQHLCDIVDSLNEADVRIPLQRIKELITELKPVATEYPWNYAFGELLLALAATHDASAREIIDEATGIENDKVTESASQALALLEGIQDPFLFIAELAETSGEDSLDEHQRRYLFLSFLDFQVCNGGFHQYFANGYGSGIRDALAGMEAIGSQAGAEVVREAIALFGPEGPAVDRMECHTQLAAFTNEQDDAMEALNSRFYDLIKTVRILMLRYAVEHKESFAPSEDAARAR